MPPGAQPGAVGANEAQPLIDPPSHPADAGPQVSPQLPGVGLLSSAWTDISGAAGTELVPSGLAAIVVALMTAL
ncbi:MAG: hypothetical protein ACLP1D_05320, partial [Xanthobacteraceae bacterium]